MVDSFTALDFETANGKRWSICQVGLVKVVGGTITDEVNFLVQPPDNYYWSNFIDIHGITPRHTANAPTFEIITTPNPKQKHALELICQIKM